VPEHVLSAGRRVIDSLEMLGQALGYVVTLEWQLPQSTAAVDVAWLRQPTDSAPLFVFEIESRPGEGLASNAMKVLGRDAVGGAKPLHLFHIVVRGGLRSRRPVDAAREFAGHNYTIHLLDDPGEPDRLLAAILAAHRRVAAGVDGIAVGMALRAPLWTEMTADAAMREVDNAGFEGLRGRPIATLALRDAGFRQTLVRHLMDTWEDVLRGDPPPPNRYLGTRGHWYLEYGSYMADAGCEALELGLIARLAPQHRSAAFRALQEWQAANHIGDSLGPFTGSGVQWTQYAINHLGYYWALVAALFAEVPAARAWCADQPRKLLESLNPAPSVNPAPFVERALLALWVMHALPLDDDSSSAYAAALRAVREVGGIAAEWLARPSPAGPNPEFAEVDEWRRLAPQNGNALVPTKADLQRLVCEAGDKPEDPVDLALQALLDDPIRRPQDGAGLVAFLARET
jgi:hypothetical protein